jgi:electron transfer flavoprotein alpha subunit
MAMNGGVLAVVETGTTGEPTVASLEMLRAARGLAEGLGRDFAVAILAEEGAPGSHKLAGSGARCVYEVRVQGSAAARDAALVEAAWLAIQTAHPAAVFFADGQAARVGAARIAARMECEFVGGCTFLKVRAGRVQMGRPCLSGKAFAQLEWDPARPVVVTVAAGAFSAPAPAGDIPEVVALELPEAPAVPGVTILSEVAPTPEAMGVNDADILVAGGAGVGGPEGFGLLVELARKLGGTVAASRVAVDRGWMPSARQVGLTGKNVSPRVYLAFGISGAPQHIAGIRSAGKVVAINRDPRAPIFEVADLAVVADLHELVPVLLDRLPALNAKTNLGGLNT